MSATPSTAPSALLQRFGGPGPRYTSYPTADRFDERFGAADALQALHERRRNTAAPLSLYVHIPFCESVCYYCACNKIVTKQHDRATEYLAALETEIGLVRTALGSVQAVSQLHLGGGTPTFLSDDELARLMAALRGAFDVAPGAEMSIEIDPRTVSAPRLQALQAMGFNRISFGVQDFDPQVQQAVHRVQSFDSVRELMAQARALGFESINADLIHGLPRQTAESFARTVEQMIALRPDRIALYAYAHLPQRFKPQRRIEISELPMPDERVAMRAAAGEAFARAGYVHIGMDHFALPHDALAVAQRQGRLHRNFQGYSTQPDSDLVALGVSAIGRIGATYSQNAKTLPEYLAALRQGRLPVERGLRLDADDLLRRDVIMALMCQGRLDFDAVGHAHGVDVRVALAPELARLAPLVDAGLVLEEAAALQVSAAGWAIVRAIAMVFDRYLHDGAARERFSKVV